MTSVVVVGGGPAGLAATVAAAEAGAEVRLIDDNSQPGGQIWRSSLGKAPVAPLRRLIEQMERLPVVVTTRTTVVDAPVHGKLLTSGPAGTESVTYDALVLATGARELFLPFPGWTLPGVMGAGGAQALLKSGADFADRRVVVSGSGPLLLAVGGTFAVSGASVIGVYEQAPMAKLARFGRKALTRHRALEGIGYLSQLGAVPYELGMWVAAAHGAGKLEAVTVTDGLRTWTEACDLLACGYGLIPNSELATLLGCATDDTGVLVDERQSTSVDSVYCAGEPCGIGGLDLALAEGAVAGRAAAGADPRDVVAKAQKLQPFRKALLEAFALREEVMALSRPDTILCRCEDVRLRDVDPSWSAREAKLACRLGMGPCQGRVCGAATRLLFGWERDRARPPLYATEVNTWAAPTRAEAQ